mmetsp:Transcript_28813/g.92799  ORF Transcript_28813/g.92799 Transcript_28813/m.92799 type:complete len:326 (+) Transcript_28813:748-1725(+)
MPLDGDERRDHCRGPDDPPPGRGLVRGHGPEEQLRHETLRHLGPRQQPHRRRGRNVHLHAGAPGKTLRRRSRRLGQSPGRHPRGLLSSGAPHRRVRRSSNGLRRPQGSRLRPRHRRRHRHGQVRRHDRRHPTALTLLQARVLRPVHPVPRRFALARGHARPHRKRRRRPQGDRHARRNHTPDRRPYDLRPRRRRRLARPGPHPTLQGRHGSQNQRSKRLRQGQSLPSILVRRTLRQQRLDQQIRTRKDLRHRLKTNKHAKVQTTRTRDADWPYLVLYLPSFLPTRERKKPSKRASRAKPSLGRLPACLPPSVEGRKEGINQSIHE